MFFGDDDGLEAEPASSVDDTILTTPRGWNGMEAERR